MNRRHFLGLGLMALPASAGTTIISRPVFTTAVPYVAQCPVELDTIIAGDTFECYSVGTISGILQDGSGWSAPWALVTLSDYLIITAYEKFDYTPANPSTEDLNGGSGMSSSWTFASLPDYYLVTAYDKFDYTVANPSTETLDDGAGMDSNWTFASLPDYLQITASESFESYSTEDPIVSTLNGGSGFSSAWTYETY